jgi:hypothetical protein
MTSFWLILLLPHYFHVPECFDQSLILLIQKFQFTKDGFLLLTLFFNDLSHYGFCLCFPVNINFPKVLGIAAVGEASIRYPDLELIISVF